MWIFAVTTYGVGDMVTTITILEFDVGVNEANLLLQQVFDSPGEAGLIGLKLAVFFLRLTETMVVVKYRDDWPMYYVPPLIRIGLVSTVTVNNMYLFSF